MNPIKLFDLTAGLPPFVIVPLAVVLAVVILYGLIKFLAAHFWKIVLLALLAVCAYAVFVYMVG